MKDNLLLEFFCPGVERQWKSYKPQACPRPRGHFLNSGVDKTVSTPAVPKSGAVFIN